MHKNFIKAGSEIIVTTNFSARRRLFGQYNLNDSLDYAIKSAGQIARKSVDEFDKKIIVAGSLPNQGNTYSPLQLETDQIMHQDFYNVAKNLNEYVDIFYLDVLSSIKEIQIALEAIKSFNKKVLIGVHLRYDAKLPSGETLNQLFEIINPVSYTHLTLPTT